MAASDPVQSGAANGVLGPRWPRVLGTLILLLAIGEAASRAYMRVWAGKPYESLAFYRWSPYGLVRNNPQLTSPSFDISPNGFRDTAVYTRRKPPGTLRVLMMGGSVLYSGLGGPAVIESEGRVGSDATMSQFLRDLLRADPALAGLKIEVINASVNFNRLPEITSAYLDEYAYWEPDVVIVCGSANNFPARRPHAGTDVAINAIEDDHPWRREFDRVNQSSLAAWFEKTTRVMSDHLASVALITKGTTAVMDAAFAITSRLGVPAPPVAPFRPDPAGDSLAAERALRDYFALADAVVASARVHEQGIAFFWEYHLGELGGRKPLSPGEQRIYPYVQVRDSLDLRYLRQTHDRVAAHFGQIGVPFVDPAEDLRSYSGTVFIDYLHYTKNGNRFMAEVIHHQLGSLIRAKTEALRSARTTLR